MVSLLGCLDFLLESSILNFFQCHLCRILLRLLLGITGAGTCRYPFDADLGVEHRIVFFVEKLLDKLE